MFHAILMTNFRNPLIYQGSSNLTLLLAGVQSCEIQTSPIPKARHQRCWTRIRHSQAIYGVNLKVITAFIYTGTALLNRQLLSQASD